MSVSYSASEPLPEDTIARLQRRLERERLSRKQAEALLEEKSRELFALNQRLANLADDLEIRVQARTSELESERERALVVSRLDQLTGLANRGCFTSYLEDICRVDIAYRKSLSLFFIDIDNFKIINDTMGHEAGDVVLRDLSARLVTLLPAGGIAARIGGDEFAIICQRLESREAVAVQAEILLDALRAPVMYRGKPVNVSCSIGVARLPDDAGNAADLQRFADMALYASKRAGRSSATVFQDSLRREAEERHALERELEAAIEAGEIIPWFQPIYNAASGSMSGVEVLARWAHPQRGVLSPLHFLPLAEERGLMDAMFRSIMRRACALCWPLVKNGHLRYVSLNVSPSQFLREPMAETVAELLAEAHFPASSLVIEITEEVLMGDVRQVGRELEALSNTGVRIALDDFGTGYSNIASLRTLPIDWLKLDRSLIRDIVDVPASRAIVRAVLQMCDALNLEIVAEGVETPDQAAWLIRAGCQRLQGYHYGRPVPFDLLFENTSRSI